jgi:NAD(P)-dependent dehydrogenase (short-subunit alcohol dehydrogenase family)
VLVGRGPEKLEEVQRTIERGGGHVIPGQCEVSDLASVRRAAKQIIALHLPIVGFLNNATILH